MQSMNVVFDGVLINVIKLQEILISDHSDLGICPGDWGKDYSTLSLTAQQAAVFLQLKDRSFRKSFPKDAQKVYIKFKCVDVCGYPKMVLLQHQKQRAQCFCLVSTNYSPLPEIFGTRCVLDFRGFQILKGITVCLLWDIPQ